MPSFSTPLSGLNANSQELSVVSNNLANLNTVGYKSEVTNFQDLFYQQIGTNGAGNPLQVGVGTKIDAVSGNFTQGSIESTGVPTDVAIQGQGFITLENNGLQEFTRAGNLSVTTNGSLVTADGGLVQGYQGVNGVINPSQALGAITIPTGLTSPPQATSNVALTLNLDSGTSIAPSPASQQTGTGILPATVLKTGSVLAISDGTNTFSYTTLAGDTLNSVINAINASPNFTASLSGNSLVISASSGNGGHIQHQFPDRRCRRHRVGNLRRFRFVHGRHVQHLDCRERRPGRISRVDLQFYKDRGQHLELFDHDSGRRCRIDRKSRGRQVGHHGF